MGFFRYLFAASKDEASAADKRRSPRFTVEESSNVHITNRPTSALLIDVSIHGARLSSRYPPEGTIHLELQVDGLRAHLPLRVLWVKSEEGWHEFGGTFMSLNAHQGAVLGSFVSRFAMSQEPLEEQNIA